MHHHPYPSKVLLLVDGNNPSYIFDDEADRDPGAMVVMDTEQNRLSINEVQLSCHEDLHIQKKLDIIVEIPQVSALLSLSQIFFVCRFVS